MHSSVKFVSTNSFFCFQEKIQHRGRDGKAKGTGHRNDGGNGGSIRGALPFLSGVDHGKVRISIPPPAKFLSHLIGQWVVYCFPNGTGFYFCRVKFESGAGGSNDGDVVLKARENQVEFWYQCVNAVRNDVKRSDINLVL